MTELHPIFKAALAPWWPPYKPKKPPKQVIHHINGDIYDNRKENLKYVNPKENIGAK